MSFPAKIRGRFGNVCRNQMSAEVALACRWRWRWRWRWENVGAGAGAGKTLIAYGWLAGFNCLWL